MYVTSSNLNVTSFEERLLNLLRHCNKKKPASQTSLHYVFIGIQEKTHRNVEINESRSVIYVFIGIIHIFEESDRHGTIMCKFRFGRSTQT